MVRAERPGDGQLSEVVDTTAVPQRVTPVRPAVPQARSPVWASPGGEIRWIRVREAYS